jgi:hypothetical protein
MIMHRYCCCDDAQPAAFISLGPDETSIPESSIGYGQLGTTEPYTPCSKFCMIDEDIIHPKVVASNYGLIGVPPEQQTEETGFGPYRDDIDENGKVRIGLEMLLHPNWGQGWRRLNEPGFRCGPDAGEEYNYPFFPGNCPPPPPTCQGSTKPGLPGLEFLDVDFTYDPEAGPNELNSVDKVVNFIFQKIEERFGTTIKPDGNVNEFPSQIWFTIDTSGSHTYSEGRQIVDALYQKYVNEYGEDVAERRMNPCWYGDYCVGAGCYEPEEITGACQTNCNNYGYPRNFSIEMFPLENYMPSIISLIDEHFFSKHCLERSEIQERCGYDTCYEFPGWGDRCLA